jgi:chromosome segregation ATPase
MSSEEQSNNDQENNNDKKNTANLNLTKEELLKNPIIKSLFVKIDVLKNGILDERKKVSELTNKIKELEDELNSKNEEIKTLKENSSSTNTYEVGKLNDEITKLKFENETFLKKMNKTLIEAEDAKHEYKNQIKSLSEKNNLLLDEINSLKLEKDKLEEKVKLVSNMSYDSVREKERFEALLSEYKKAKEEAIHQLDACLEKCSKLAMKNKEYEDSIALHESNANKMALKLAEYKNMLIKVNLRNQIYHVKRVGLVSHNNGMDITFGQDKEGNYVMRIDDEKGNVELINIQDVESVNQINEKNNKVEIKYMYKSKKCCLNVFVDELVIDQFVEAYKNFYSESMKNTNRVNY